MEGTKTEWGDIMLFWLSFYARPASLLPDNCQSLVDAYVHVNIIDGLRRLRFLMLRTVRPFACILHVLTQLRNKFHFAFHSLHLDARQVI